MPVRLAIRPRPWPLESGLRQPEGVVEVPYQAGIVSECDNRPDGPSLWVLSIIIRDGVNETNPYVKPGRISRTRLPDRGSNSVQPTLGQAIERRRESLTFRLARRVS